MEGRDYANTFTTYWQWYHYPVYMHRNPTVEDWKKSKNKPIPDNVTFPVSFTHY